MVSEEKMYEECGWMDDEQTDNRAWLYYKFTNESKGSGELKIVDIQNVNTFSCHWVYFTINFDASCVVKLEFQIVTTGSTVRCAANCATEPSPI